MAETRMSVPIAAVEGVVPEEIGEAIRSLESAAWSGGNVGTRGMSRGYETARAALDATILRHLSAALARAERLEKALEMDAQIVGQPMLVWNAKTKGWHVLGEDGARFALVLASPAPVEES